MNNYFVYRFFFAERKVLLQYLSKAAFSRILVLLYSNFFSLNLAANAQVVFDESLGKPTVTPTNIKGASVELISDGVRRGTNLFYSFEQFNILAKQRVYFDSPLEINNIIGRVTGGDISSILGVLGVQGNANLFIINPNGIKFGPNSSLDLNGSFVATTANSIRFGNQGSFNVEKNNELPQLTVNPSGFIFARENIAPIVNQSQAEFGTRINPDPSLNSKQQIVSLKGLNVPSGKDLILLGGDITLDNGGLYALGGNIKIGSIAQQGTVDLSFDGQNFSLDLPQSLSRGNISFINGSRVDTSGNSSSSGGNIQIIGNNIIIKDKSQIISTSINQDGNGSLKFDAANILDVIGPTPRGGNTFTAGYAGARGGDTIITARKFTVQNGAQLNSGSFDGGKGGDFIIKASESVEVSGVDSRGLQSIISSSTFDNGVGGIISIETPGSVSINQGAAILSGGTGYQTQTRGTILPTGNGGNIVITAGGSVNIDQVSGQLPSRISATNDGSGKAGDIEIVSTLLNVRNSFVEVSSVFGQAGELKVNTKSLTLDGGTLSADTADTKFTGANISLKMLDLLRLENESLISATASNNANGGNITIDTPILLAFPSGPEGSDIIAKADKGRGGIIKINSKGIFGIQQRKTMDGNQTNDIDASSQFGQSGQIQIRTTTELNREFVDLPATVVDPNYLIAQNPCSRGPRSQFVNSGRGGLPPSLSQDLDSQSTQVSLVKPLASHSSQAKSEEALEGPSSLPLSPQKVIPAKGWIYNGEGKVVLVGYNSADTTSEHFKPTTPGCPVQ